MRTYFILIVSAIFLITSLTSRFAGAISYWWFATFRPQDWVFTDITNLRLSLIATVLFVIPCLIQGKIPSFKNNLIKLIFTYFFLVVIAKLVSNCMVLEINSNKFFYFMITFVTVIFTPRVINRPNYFFILILMLGCTIGFHAGKTGISSMLTGEVRYGFTGLGGFYTGSNAFAMASAMMFFFTLASTLIIYDKNLTRSLTVRKIPFFLKSLKILMPIMTLGVIFNVITLFSRGSALALFTGIVLWLFLSKMFKFKHLFLLTILGMLALFFIELPEGYVSRIESIFAESGTLDKSAASRPFFWNIAYEMAKDNILGVSAGCYNTFYNFYDSTNGYYGFSRTVHSSHFEVLSETGFLGLLVWILLFAVAVKKCFKIRRNCIEKMHKKPSARLYFIFANMLIAIMITFILGGSFYALSYTPIIWLTLGLVVSLENISTRKLRDAKR